MSDSIRTWLYDYVHDPTFVGKYRYYAGVLARLDAVADPFVHVMAVSAHGARFYLHVNVDFFTRPPSNVQYLRGVLLHEVHHIVLGHVSNPKFQKPEHPDLMQLAMEMSANEYIREPLPGQPVLWQDFVRLGVHSGQSTLERYECLVQARCEGRLPRWVAVFVDDHLPRGVGRCDAAPPLDPGLHVRVHRLLRDAIEDARKGGASPGGLLWGRDPGRFLEELPDTEVEPERFMNWKAAVHMFVGLVRAPLHTYRRPSRRFPDKVGLIPGRMFFPSAGKPSVLIAIDTSGSMSGEELAEIAGQLRPLSDLVRITVVECDAAIQRVYPFEGTITEMAGRGGTDLRPVFAADFLREHRPDGVIYFTDGEGPFPPDDPGVKTLWVLSKPWGFACPWGIKAHLARAETARGAPSRSPG
jgi:predicted metal-dependent peptidase